MGKLAALGKAALDMSHDARMQRARDMGFDTDRVFTTRSSDESISEIHSGGRFGGLFTLESDDSPHGFGDYTHQFFARSGRVADDGDWDLDSERAFAFLKEQFPDLPDEKIDEIYDLTAGDKDIYQYYSSETPDGYDPMLFAEMNNPIDSDLAEASWTAQKLRGQIAADQGFDAIAMSDEYGTSYLFPHGSKARSVNAAFDPAKKDSSNLMAGLAGGAVGLGALQSEEADASMASIGSKPKKLSEIKRRGLGASKEQGDISRSELSSAPMEIMAGINRGFTDSADFLVSDVPNAFLEMLGSDKRVNSLYDIPYVDEATQGNFMPEGKSRDKVRTLSEFLSPL